MSKKREQVMPRSLGEDEADAGSPKLPGLSKDGVGGPICNLGANFLNKRLDLVLHRVEACFGKKCRVENMNGMLGSKSCIVEGEKDEEEDDIAGRDSKVVVVDVKMNSSRILRCNA